MNPYSVQCFRGSKTHLAIALLVAAFSLTAIQRFWVNPSGGHTYRQAVTIGMSISFAEEVHKRGAAALDFIFYPRVLERGLLDGINASEFPLLNALSLPFFLAGNPFVGVFLTSLLLLAFNLLTAYFFLPRFLKAWRVEVPGILGLLFWLAGGTVATQTSILMPEGLAFPLTLIGLVQILEAQKPGKLVWGALLCSAGIAAKPTVVLMLGPLLLVPLLLPEYRTRLWTILAAAAGSLAFPAWWYAIHSKQILATAQGPQVFALAKFEPFAKLAELGPSGILTVLLREPHMAQFPLYLGWPLIVAALWMGEWLLVATYLVSLIVAAALDGMHILIHEYYFIGCGIFSILLMARTLGALKHRRPAVAAALVVVLCWGVVFNIRENVWIWARDSKLWAASPWSAGTQARNLIPADYHLVTDDGRYPQKLLFVGRSGTAARSAVDEACTGLLAHGVRLAVLTDTPPGAACLANASEKRVIETPYATWHLALIGARAQTGLR
jgi:hypothetical protein